MLCYSRFIWIQCFILHSVSFCVVFILSVRIKSCICTIRGITWKSLSMIMARSLSGNTAVIPGGHWGHLPGLHQRRVSQWPRIHWTHSDWGGLLSVNEKWHAECAGPCLDNNPIMTPCLQYTKDNDPCVSESGGKSLHLHVREGQSRKVAREREWQMGRPEVKFTGLRLWSAFVCLCPCLSSCIVFQHSPIPCVVVRLHMCVSVYV